jgi:hypothetical protein
MPTAHICRLLPIYAHGIAGLDALRAFQDGIISTNNMIPLTLYVSKLIDVRLGIALEFPTIDGSSLANSKIPARRENRCTSSR